MWNVGEKTHTSERASGDGVVSCESHISMKVGWERLSYVASERKIKLEFFFPKTYSTGGAIFYRVRLSVVPGASGPLPGKSS